MRGSRGYLSARVKMADDNSDGDNSGGDNRGGMGMLALAARRASGPAGNPADSPAGSPQSGNAQAELLEKTGDYIDNLRDIFFMTQKLRMDLRIVEDSLKQLATLVQLRYAQLSLLRAAVKNREEVEDILGFGETKILAETCMEKLDRFFECGAMNQINYVLKQVLDTNNRDSLHSMVKRCMQNTEGSDDVLAKLLHRLTQDNPAHNPVPVPAPAPARATAAAADDDKANKSYAWSASLEKSFKEIIGQVKKANSTSKIPWQVVVEMWLEKHPEDKGKKTRMKNILAEKYRRLKNQGGLSDTNDEDDLPRKRTSSDRGGRSDNDDNDDDDDDDDDEDEDEDEDEEDGEKRKQRRGANRNNKRQKSTQAQQAPEER